MLARRPERQLGEGCAVRSDNWGKARRPINRVRGGGRNAPRPVHRCGGLRRTGSRHPPILPPPSLGISTPCNSAIWAAPASRFRLSASAATISASGSTRPAPTPWSTPRSMPAFRCSTPPDIYGGRGKSEEFLGKSLGPRRKDIVLASKFGCAWPRGLTASARRATTSCTRSSGASGGSARTGSTSTSSTSPTR